MATTRLTARRTRSTGATGLAVGIVRDAQGQGWFRSGTELGPGFFQLYLQMAAQLIQAGLRPPIARLRGIGGQVVQFPPVVERVPAIDRTAGAVDGTAAGPTTPSTSLAANTFPLSSNRSACEMCHFPS